MTKPSVIITNKLLPFNELSPLEFERLCLWLVEREGYERPQHLGEAGGDQGRDIVAYKNTDAGKEIWYFQCKRYNRITATTLKKEVDKYSGLTKAASNKQPAGIIFVTNAAVSAKIRDDVGEYCRLYGYECDFWARTELDMRVKKHPEIIEEFFGLPRIPTVTALHQLPPFPLDFTGRSGDLDELMSAFEGGGTTIFCLQGIGGIGKTTLALKLADQLTTDYPDAQIYLDLKGTSRQPLFPRDVMAHVIHSFHPTVKLPDSEAALTGLYRSVLHKKRVLLLMDNAANVAQIEAALPPSSCGLIITTRQHFTLPGLLAKNLEIMAANDASSFLLRIAPRINDQAGIIAKLCGYLPLALRLAGSALAECVDLSVADYIQSLTDTKQRLKLINASLNMSYELLSPSMQKLWRALAVFPDTFNIKAVQRIWKQKSDTSQEALSELVRFSLVEWSGATARYRLHDLARLVADSLLKNRERKEYQKRHATLFANYLEAVNELYTQGGDNIKKSLQLFDLEWTNIQAGQLWAKEHSDEDDTAAALCSNYSLAANLLYLRQRPRERLQWLQPSLACARRLKNREAESSHLSNLGVVYIVLGDPLRAIESLEDALIIVQQAGDRKGEAHVLGNLGLAYDEIDETDRSIECFKRQLAISREISDRSGEGYALGNLGIANARLGEFRRSIESFELQLAIAQELGDRIAEGNGVGNIGIVYYLIGQPALAIRFLEQWVNIARETDDSRGEGTALWNMSLALHQMGEHTQAMSCGAIALKVFEQIEDPHADTVREQLAEWRNTL